MTYQEIFKWLEGGDVSIRYQGYRDLLDKKDANLQKRIESEGWGRAFLDRRLPSGHWGSKFYYPKWTSTHYTLLDLKNLSISPDNSLIRETIDMLLETHKGPEGGMLPSDMCIDGMFLNYSSYFMAQEEKLKSIVDYILSQKMADGGFNCRLARSGAKHSSMHTTISVLEGINEYLINGYAYRANDMREALGSGKEFLLQHKLFLSDRTGEVIDKNFLKLPYPSRWKYDILRGLDLFVSSGSPWDDRLAPAIEVLLNKRTPDGRWKVNAKYQGVIHFEMEKAGRVSRINTLRALRVLLLYGYIDLTN